MNSVEARSLFQILLSEEILKPDSSLISRDASASLMQHAERLFTRVLGASGLAVCVCLCLLPFLTNTHKYTHASYYKTERGSSSFDGSGNAAEI